MNYQDKEESLSLMNELLAYQRTKKDEGSFLNEIKGFK